MYKKLYFFPCSMSSFHNLLMGLTCGFILRRTRDPSSSYIYTRCQMELLKHMDGTHTNHARKCTPFCKFELVRLSLLAW